MIKIYLVRHGEATEGWTSQDPPLSELGKSQAQSLMTFMDSVIDESSINNTNAISSPLNRCKETASLALEKKYLEILINDNFRELPSPTLDLEKRVNWLRRILPLTWPELLRDKETIDSRVNFTQWKANIMSNIYSLKKHTIIFTHFVVINTVIGEILKSDKIVNFHPSNCSITEISKIKDKLKIVKIGKSLESKVN
ncbi:MAG: histidine phosphatase family protein [Alphaproteobacteria bacterium]